MKHKSTRLNATRTGQVQQDYYSKHHRTRKRAISSHLIVMYFRMIKQSQMELVAIFNLIL